MSEGWRKPTSVTTAVTGPAVPTCSYSPIVRHVKLLPSRPASSWLRSGRSEMRRIARSPDIVVAPEQAAFSSKRDLIPQWGGLPIFSEAWRPISASRRTDTSDMVPLGLADWASSCPLLDELFTPRHNSAPSGPGLAVIRANYLFMRLLENYTRPRVLHACPLIEERANVATSITAQE